MCTFPRLKFENIFSDQQTFSPSGYIHMRQLQTKTYMYIHICIAYQNYQTRNNMNFSCLSNGQSMKSSSYLHLTAFPRA